MARAIGDEDAIDLRLRMVTDQIAARGVRSPRVLGALAVVPRERFAAGAPPDRAYGDGALPIGCGQTISQPYMVARMIDLLSLSGEERVLEIGTGLGYQAAVLSRIAREVVTVERMPDLAAGARVLLRELGFDNVEVVQGDGSLGWPARAPYGGIIVAAAAPSIPPALVEQLAPGARLIAPVGGRGEQVLVRLSRLGPEIREERFDRCVFVPLVGEQGFEE